MLVEDELVKKSKSKTISENHELFQKFQSHYPGLWIQDQTSEQNFGTPLSNKRSHLFLFTLTL